MGGSSVRTAEVANAFRIAARYKPTLTRYERQQVLLEAARLLALRRVQVSDLITAETGLAKKDSLHEVSRACDVLSLAGQMCIIDDSAIFSCDITSLGTKRKVFTQREPLQAISAITPFNHPLNLVAHKVAPAIATNNCIVCKPADLAPGSALLLADIDESFEKATSVCI